MQHWIAFLTMLGLSVLSSIGAVRAAEENCALYVENSTLCLAGDLEPKQCVSIARYQLADIERYQCLVASLDLIRGCDLIMIAQNIIVRFQPLRISRGDVYFTPPSNELFRPIRTTRPCNKR